MDTERFETEKCEHEKREKGGWGLFRVCWVGCVLVVLYGLSIGPVMKIHRPGGTREVVVHVYWPLWTVAEHTPGGEQLLVWYVYRLWRVPEVVD